VHAHWLLARLPRRFPALMSATNRLGRADFTARIAENGRVAKIGNAATHRHRRNQLH